MVNGSNQINNQAQLASLTSAAVVKPNVDTLYSRVIIDLSQGDLELTVPNITDRFWIYPFYDTYVAHHLHPTTQAQVCIDNSRFGNNFANISPVNYSQPGVYLVRRADDALARPGIEFPGPASYSKYQGIVNSPTTYGTLLIRLLLKYNTTENLDIVHRIQNETKLVPVPRVIQQPYTLAAPPFTGSLINDSLTGTPPEQLLQLLSRIAVYNQPARLSERYRIANILGQAGLVSGTYIRPAGVNITQAYAIANATIQKYISDPNTINFVGNNWQLQKPGYAVGTPFRNTIDTSNSSPSLGRLRLKLRAPSLYSPHRLPANSPLHNHLSRPQRPAFQRLRPTSQPILPLHIFRQTPRYLLPLWLLEFNILRPGSVPHPKPTKHLLGRRSLKYYLR